MGYGRTYLHAADGRKREDAVKDVGALRDWVVNSGGGDGKNIFIDGASLAGTWCYQASIITQGPLPAASTSTVWPIGSIFSKTPLHAAAHALLRIFSLICFKDKPLLLMPFGGLWTWN